MIPLAPLVGKRIRLKDNIGLLYEILDSGIDGCHFDFSILWSAPAEGIRSALQGIVPADQKTPAAYQKSLR